MVQYSHCCLVFVFKKALENGEAEATTPTSPTTPSTPAPPSAPPTPTAGKYWGGGAKGGGGGGFFQVFCLFVCVAELFVFHILVDKDVARTIRIVFSQQFMLLIALFCV